MPRVRRKERSGHWLTSYMALGLGFQESVAAGQETGRSVCGYVRSVARLCPNLCSPMDCSPPGSSAHGLSQARIQTGMGCHISFLQGVSLTQRSNPHPLHLLYWQEGSLPVLPPRQPCGYVGRVLFQTEGKQRTNCFYSRTAWVCVCVCACACPWGCKELDTTEELTLSPFSHV